MAYVNPRVYVSEVEETVIDKKTKEKKLVTRLVVDEDKLDLFSYPDLVIPPPRMMVKPKPYNELTVVYIDIETTGLDPDIDRITMIGAMNEKGKYHIYDVIEQGEHGEKLMLSKFIGHLLAKNPDVIALYNGFKFDLPFIIKRCQIHGIPHPFVPDTRRCYLPIENLYDEQGELVSTYDYEDVEMPRMTVMRTAVRFNKPEEFQSIKYDPRRARDPRYTKTKHIAIIDLYHQTLAYDFVKRSMTSYTLKQAALQMDLRKEARTELPYEEILKAYDCWFTEFRDGKTGKELMSEYLFYDLEDTKLIAEKLLPSIYYQKILLPDWDFQALSTAGNGSKWNSRAKTIYSNQKPVTELKKLYKGGFTDGYAGLYRNVVKIDVRSLYPSIMLTYGITSIKDINLYILADLLYLTNERLALKDAVSRCEKELKRHKKEKHLTPEQEFQIIKKMSEADQLQGAMKIMINSLYGALGTQGIGFNDYTAAALVTAYGRRIVKLMAELVIKNGGTIAEIDTDGVCYACEPGTERVIYEQVCKGMPKGIEIEYEWCATAFYVPPVDTSKLSKKKQAEHDHSKGQKKNYIIFFDNGKIKATGKYRKRDKCKLDKNFQKEFIKRLLVNKDDAIAYYQKYYREILAWKTPVEDFIINRKISIKEKRLVELGIGQQGEVVSYYMGFQGTETKEGYYDAIYYSQRLTKYYEEVMNYL